MIVFRLLLAELLTCLARRLAMGVEEEVGQRLSVASPASPRGPAKRSATEHLHRCYQLDSSDHQP
jgi:hypothetical protein